jgi:hypothetical protein
VSITQGVVRIVNGTVSTAFRVLAITGSFLDPSYDTATAASRAADRWHDGLRRSFGPGASILHAGPSRGDSGSHEVRAGSAADAAAAVRPATSGIAALQTLLDCFPVSDRWGITLGATTRVGAGLGAGPDGTTGVRA